jgi:hypothetical protein
LDVLSLYLLVPGFLLLHPSQHHPWYGYLWLFCATAYFLVRCLFDLALVTRPALGANLTPSGLTFLGGALLMSLVAVALRPPEQPDESGHPGTTPVDQADKETIKIVGNLTGGLGDPQVWARRALAILCHVGILAALIFIGYLHFSDTHAGIAAATFYLLLPYTYMLLPYTALQLGQWYHVWPMTMILWAVACYRMPTLSGVFLGLAVGTVYFPVVVLPLWISFYWGRGAGRFAAASLLTAALCLTLIGGTLLYAPQRLPPDLVDQLSEWRPWVQLDTGVTHGFWTRDLPGGWAYRIPVFVLYVAFVITTIFWPSPKNLAQLTALTAALLIGLQLWYADQGGIYVFWYLPLLLVLMFRPNLSDRRPLPIVPELDWLTRFRKTLWRWSQKFTGAGRTPVRVS